MLISDIEFIYLVKEKTDLYTHNSPHVPDQQPLIPRTTRTPSLTSKQTPIHPSNKLGMSAHSPQLLSHASRGHAISNAHRAPIAPNTTCHVVTCAQQHIRKVRTPSQFPHCVIVALQERERTSGRGANIKGTDDAVDARSSNDTVAILVPIVRKCFRRRERRGRPVVANGGDVGRVMLIGSGRVDGDLTDEVVGC